MSSHVSGVVGVKRVPLGVALQVTVIALLLLGYRVTFFAAYRVVDSEAFLLAMIPCVAAGTMLGVWGGVAAVAASFMIDRSLALAVGFDLKTGIPALAMSVVIKLLLGVGAGLIVESKRHLSLANSQMAGEVKRRKLSEGRLGESERRYRALVESLGEGVGLFDSADECIFANPAMAKAFDRPRDAIVGVNFADLVAAPNRQTSAKWRADHGSGAITYEVAPKERADRVLLVTETRLNGDAETDHGEGQQTLRVIRDFTYHIETERKQRELERQLQRGQALQSMAVLAGGVAHDFNNLLSGIVGNAEYALRRVPSAAPLELTQCIEEMREFATEASQLSRQMLAYAGRRSLAVGPVDVNREVREALRLVHSTIESQATLNLELMSETPAVKADRIQLRQVITNLLLNALEAMAPKRGAITIRTQEEQLDASDLLAAGAPEGLSPGRFVVISVSDNGVGIPDELRERIFEPFFSTKSPGRGMGLAASVGIVRSHRGWLEVRSERGAGSTFRVLLPLADGATDTVRRLTPMELVPSRSGNILIIDDEVAVRVVTNRLLTDLGQRVLAADGGRRGIELFRQNQSKIDLVLLDMTMPEISGAEVLDELRRIRKDVRVVVTSGFHPSNASNLLGMPNVIGFLEKPHTMANLEAIVATVFAN